MSAGKPSKPTVVLLSAGPIRTFATSYRGLALAQCLVEDYGVEAHVVLAADEEDRRLYGHVHKGVCLHYVNDLPILLTGWRCDPQLLLRTLWRTWRRLRTARSLRPDVVHVLKPLPETLLAGFALKLLGCKVVLDEDDADADMMVANGHATDAWRYGLTRFLSRIGHRLCHAVTVASRAYVDAYARRGAAVTYLPNGIFAEEFREGLTRPQRPRGAVTALYLGALERCFDADLAVEAFAAAVQRCPALRLLVVGDGPLRGDLQARAEELGCGHAVEFVGRVPKDEVIHWLNRAHVFLFPMRPTWINECRCPLKLREFAATGKPLIAPAFGEVLEAAPAKDALVAPHADAQEYGRKLAHVAQGLIDGTRPAPALPAASEFDWHPLAKRLVAAYNQLLHVPIAPPTGASARLPST